MEIRDEIEKDWNAIHDVNTSAFETAAEANLVDALRGAVEPVVSLIAINNGDIVGHIMFAPVILTGHPDIMIMGLAPMAVLPELQRRGIGSELVTVGLDRCGNLGVGAVVVLGHPEYYPRFGFKLSTTFGIGCEYEVPEEVFLVKELLPGCLKGKSGIIKYHEVFKNV